MRVGDAVQGQQQGGPGSTFKQFVEHVLTPDLAGTDFGHHALVHAFGPLVQLVAVLVADRDAVLPGQV
ncbi:hypothetical protein D3C71_1760790 [compost metagenome]